MSKKCSCQLKIYNVGGNGNQVIDGVINGGQVIGDTLVITDTNGGTVNIPLIGNGSGIDFSTLIPVHVTALATALRGNLVLDLANNPTGYLLPL